MNQNNQPEKEGKETQQNPTLNAPGSKVADYGNSTGGSAVEDQPSSDRGTQSKPESPHVQEGETLGNP